VFSKSSNACH